MAEPNSSFSKQLPALQIAWDSTSLGALKKCPRFYQLSIIEGFAPKRESIDLRFGLHYHAALERYDHRRSAGDGHETALRFVVQYALEVTWDATLGRPWDSGDNNKNRFTLIRSIVFYLDRFGADDPFETIQLASGKPAIELSFRLTLDYESHQTGEKFILCGHLDRLAKHQDQIYIMDRKTTKRTLNEYYFDQFSPDNQFSLYPFAGQIVYSVPLRGIIADAAQIMVEDTRFERMPIGRTESQLTEWHRDLGFWLTTAQMHARANYWPMNDKACFGCQFRPICSKPESVRAQWLAAEFTRRTWDPLQIRGDV